MTQMDLLKLLSKSDPILGRIIEVIPKPNIVSTNNVFHDLMSCILEQQIHYRSTKKVFHKMLGLSGLKELNYKDFSIFEEKALGSIKLSKSKYETLNAVLDFWEKKNSDKNELPEEFLINQISALKGIGKWTIDMLSLYTLQKPDVFPSDDFHLKQIMVDVYDLNANAKLKSQMISMAEKWGSTKSLAVLYLLDWKTQRKR